jgi:2-pyrone-4,6-dicarboxylate lactonase
MTLERTIPPPHPNPHPPTRFTPPPNATNGHCHVFGPADRFPFAEGRAYTPPDSGYELFREHQARMGLERAILVQASCHGTDNSAMLDALERAQGKYAGVALIDDTHTEEDLIAFHDAGIRGIRFNFVEHLGGAPDPEFFWRQVDRVVPLGWHVELHFDARDLSANADLFERLPVPFIIDAMGRVDAAAGLDQEPFQYLLNMMRTDGRAWVKVSGAERITVDGTPPYDDVVPYAVALVEAAPDRTLWGTDWPHPNVRHMPDDGDLIDLLADIAPDEEARNRILVDNAERLYDFS